MPSSTSSVSGSSNKVKPAVAGFVCLVVVVRPGVERHLWRKGSNPRAASTVYVSGYPDSMAYSQRILCGDVLGMAPLTPRPMAGMPLSFLSSPPAVAPLAVRIGSSPVAVSLAIVTIRRAFCSSRSACLTARSRPAAGRSHDVRGCLKLLPPVRFVPPATHGQRLPSSH